MSFNKLTFFVFVICAQWVSTFAQDDCAITLKNAQKTYEEGAIEKVADVLAPCLEKGFSRDQKVQAYKLLVLASFFENNRYEAEGYMIKLLRLDPEYKINTSVDPPEFIKLYDSYRTLPLYSIGGTLSGNYSFVHVLNKYTIADVNTSPGKYSGAASYQGGINANMYLFDKAELCLDVLFMSSRFRYNNDGIYDGFTSVNNNKKAEVQTWIGVPLSMTYDLTKSNTIKPYARLGGGVGFLMSDLLHIERSFNNSSATGPDIDMITQRNTKNYWVCIGGGAKYKIPNAFITLDLRYNLGLMNQVNGAQRYSNTELIYKYYYIDSDFKVSNLTFSIGYTRLLYKPQKKK